MKRSHLYSKKYLMYIIFREKGVVNQENQGTSETEKERDFYLTEMADITVL